VSERLSPFQFSRMQTHLELPLDEVDAKMNVRLQVEVNLGPSQDSSFLGRSHFDTLCIAHSTQGFIVVVGVQDELCMPRIIRQRKNRNRPRADSHAWRLLRPASPPEDHRRSAGARSAARVARALVRRGEEFRMNSVCRGSSVSEKTVIAPELTATPGSPTVPALLRDERAVASRGKLRTFSRLELPWPVSF
jgi:hypothetical protein